MNFAVYYEGALKMCGDTNGYVPKGYQLCGECTKFVAVDVYNEKYKANYPQATNILVVPSYIMEKICQLKCVDSMPAGYLVGKKAVVLSGETSRMICDDFIPFTCVNFRLTLSTKDTVRFKSLQGNNKTVLGKFKVANRLGTQMSKQSNDMINSIGVGQVFCLISASTNGNQKAILKNKADTAEVGVYITDDDQ